jgi:hypothetical protein
MKNDGGPYRDHDLGEALRELEVPEHREAFFADLETRLTAQRRRPLLRPLAVAVAAGMALLLFVTVGRPHLRGGPSVARAAAVRSQVLKTLAEARTIRGELVYSSFDVRTGKTTTRSQTFAADSRGDLRLTDVGGPSDLAYDAARRVERAVTTSASIGAGRFFAERVGVAPGLPDHGPSSFILGRELGAVVRALAAARSPQVAEATYRGRAAWRLDTPLEPNTIFADADRLQITVDRETGFPVHVLATLRGAFRSELRVDKLVVDEALPPDAFTVNLPAGADVLRTDEGFAHVSRDEAATIVGYQPLVPADVPDGFGLTSIAVAKEAAPTGPGESNPPSRDVVSIAYRRGLDQFVVTTRRQGARDWADPFAVEGIRLAAEHVGVAGASWKLVVDSRTVPHVWGVRNGLVVTVSGDLTRAELVAVARSLH